MITLLTVLDTHPLLLMSTYLNAFSIVSSSSSMMALKLVQETGVQETGGPEELGVVTGVGTEADVVSEMQNRVEVNLKLSAFDWFCHNLCKFPIRGH